jgi:hypothetical protein
MITQQDLIDLLLWVIGIVSMPVAGGLLYGFIIEKMNIPARIVLFFLSLVMVFPSWLLTTVGSSTEQIVGFISAVGHSFAFVWFSIWLIYTPSNR